MRSPVCNNCGGPAILGEVPIEKHHLLIENARLKDELNRLGLLAKKFMGKTINSMPPIDGNSCMDLVVGKNNFSGSFDPALSSGLEFSNQASHGFSVGLSSGPVTSLTNVNASFDKSLLLELALAAMDELIKLSQLDSPLWFRNIEGSGESLNFEEYTKTFSSCIGLKPGHFVSDGTRYTGVVMIKSVTLMETLMNVPKMENLGDMSLTRQSYGLPGRRREDELENRSESDNLEGASGVDQNTSGNGSSKRKKYHKHSAFQIQELETSFKDNPHADEKQRAELGERLGLEIRQIKFWFQNRRTQMKTQLERHENLILKEENDKLRVENISVKETMRSPVCNNCGGPAILGEVPIEKHHLLIENARLKDELNRLGLLAKKFMGKTINSMPPIDGNSCMDLVVGKNNFSGSFDPALSSGLEFGNQASHGFSVGLSSGPVTSLTNVNASFDKSLLLELALAAMDELIKLSQLDSPLWFRNIEGSGESLNFEEYTKTFSSCIGLKPGHFVSDGTRYTGVVMIKSVTLMETLMNMQAEFQVLSPMVHVRQAKFVRFCKQHADDIWVVVDVSVDTIFDGLRGTTSMNCRRLPSGCIVQDMSNGYSKVTWIEHIEYDENVVHQIYRPLLRSGMAYGAKKWVANLQKQCELFSAIMSSIPLVGDNSEIPRSGKKSIAKLAQQMTRSFSTGVCATIHKWEALHITDDTRILMRKANGSFGEPLGVILSATTTAWMPISPHSLLAFLQNEKARSYWDVLSQDGPMKQILHIPKSPDLGNSISLLRANVPIGHSNMLILQDTYADAIGSVIIHAAIGTAKMNAVLNGEDLANVAILPSGFVIMPDCFPDSGTGCRVCGSLLTVGFQILANSPTIAMPATESFATVKSLITRTVQGIQSGLLHS
ncbi:hypothetical protein RD792_005343 [Penstemon davidsonii]|uniref:Uncharacterized protein n=1 Tax=Penstemon davidsonii TaxID=160366 RepID=A0ABR0DJV7_9LAMI|nr:hypothetical protein RD792_005343 [Penstemon davidsonii]